MSTTYQQQPSANQLKQEKSHSQPPSACHLITLQHLASPIQPILPTRPTVCLPFVISSLLKTKNTSKFSCFIQYTADYSFESEETAGLKRLFFFFSFFFFFTILLFDSVWKFTFPEISIIDIHLVCLGALSRIMKSHKSKLFSTPQWISLFFVFYAVWLVLAYLSLVTTQDLFPVTTILFLLLASNFLCASFKCSGPVSYRWWPLCVSFYSHTTASPQCLWGSDTTSIVIFTVDTSYFDLHMALWDRWQGIPKHLPSLCTRSIASELCFQTEVIVFLEKPPSL